MKFLRFALVAAASTLAFSAQADTTDWGVHSALEVGVSLTPVGSFADTYLFKRLDPMALFAITVANNQLPALKVDDGMLTLFQEAGPVDVSLGSFAFDGTTGSTAHASGSLAGGDHNYQGTGTGAGTRGGFYAISSQVSAVREPESYALMLAGLGVIGFLGLRRRSATDSR